MTAFEIDHDRDPRDDALSYVTLDGTPAVLCDTCDRLIGDCACCSICSGLRPCPCDVPFSQREERAMRDRAGKAWRS